MPRSEFSEDQFEQHLLLELRERYSLGLPHFKPSRVLERDVGYDLAMHTSFERLVAPGVFANDLRLQALLPIQRRAMLPTTYVTSFVQCKVPYFATRRSQTTRRGFQRWNQKFYRFEIISHQNDVLARTEQLLSGEGLVRYAAPCFVTFAECDDFCLRGQILQRTHFVSPAKLRGHSEYTYVRPLQGGAAFSDLEEVNVSPLLYDVSVALAQGRTASLAAHVSTVWTAIRESVREESLVRPRALVQAARLLGDEAYLPLDPLGLGKSRRLDLSYPGWPDDASEPTLLSFAAALLSIEWTAREFLRSFPRIFARRRNFNPP